MKQEEKTLLLKDLCARLPYGVKCKYSGEIPMLGRVTNNVGELQQINLSNSSPFMIHDGNYGFDDVLPFLRPMSSMTEEEDKEWQFYKSSIADSCDELLEQKVAELHEWFNVNHLDFRGLIPKGLSLEAPADMYKTK